VVLNKNRKIQLWNTSAQKIFGYKEQEILNKSINLIIPQEEEDVNKKLIEEVEKNKIIRNYETLRQSKTGEKISVSVSVAKVTNEKDKFIGYLVTYRDISSQKRTSNELQKRFETIQDAYKELGFQRRQMDYLAEITESAVSNASLDSLQNLIISAIVLLSKADAAVLRLYNKKNKFLEMVSHIGIDKKWQSKNRIEFDNSIAQDAFEIKRPLLMDNVEASDVHKSRNLVKSHKFKTLISIPLFLSKKYLGSLNIYSKDPGKFRLIETDFLQKFGQQCSLAISIKLHKL